VAAAICGVALSSAYPAAVRAQVAGPQPAPTAEQTFDIPAGPLAPALRSLASSASVLLIFTPDQTEGKTTEGIEGRYTTQEALAALLARSGLQAVQQDSGGYVLRPSSTAQAAPAESAVSEKTLPAVRVTANLEPSPGLYAGGQVARGAHVGLLGNKDVMDTPFNLNSYTAAFIQNQFADTVGGVLNNDPSIRHLSDPGSGYQGYFSIRGFRVNSSDISFNGLYGLASGYGGVPTEFVERVEVLKGASALLYGMSPNGAVGGAINLVPKRATDQPITRGTVGFDSDALWTVAADVGRRFGANNEWGLRVNGSYEDGDTALDDQSRRRLLGSVALDYQGERLRLALDAYGFRENNRGGDISGFFLTGLTRVPKAPKGSTNIAPGLNWNAETGGVMFSGEYDISKAVTAYAKIGMMNYNRDGFSTNGTRNLQDNGDASVLITNFPCRSDNISGEVGLRSAFRTGALHHALALSASRLNMDVKQAFSSVSVATNIYAPAKITGWPATPAVVPKVSYGVLQGIALADTMSTSEERVQLTLGIRRQNVKTNNYSTSGIITSRYDKSAWTPMAGLVVKPLDHLSLYANYIEGLSQGTTVSTAYQNAGEVFPPYKTKQVEIGAKLETGAIINTVDLFQMKQPSTLTDNSTLPLPTLRLDGAQRNRGIEWNVFGEVLPGVRLIGGATYMQGRLTKTQGGAYDGNDAPGAAYWGFNIGGEWDPHSIPGLTLTGRLIHTSAQYADNANTLKLPDWTRIDVGARYSTELAKKAVVFRAGVTNLLNKNYYQGLQFQDNAIIGEPRTFQLSASVDF
jgi:iron complex outermembrane receptor protein